MFDQIKNRKGENLYILTNMSTNSIKPFIYVNTWEECIKNFEEITKEVNNNSFFTQLVHKEIDEEMHNAEASLRCNHKGWGYDYFSYITIRPLYTKAW